ncbi:MAG: 3-deoxy-7-phosphoheptulonate synthase [Nitrospinota bacterium]|nr:MAG: 3-deoxy-7-phosphoheptulonate synthase [Nitrospinota bacterium]
MIIKMKRQATPEQIEEVKQRLYELGPYEIGDIVGTERVVIGVKGDVTALPEDQIRELSGVEEVILISKKYKRASLEYRTQLNHGSLYSRVDVGGVTIGGDELVVIAGPCVVESQEQILTTAKYVKDAGAQLLRGGAFKPRTSPYSFDGLKEEGLRYLQVARKEIGLPVVTEIMSERQIDLFEKYEVDCYQVGSRNGRNQELLNALRSVSKPVLLKREMGTPVEEYLLYAERLMVDGKENVILCERGITTFETFTRNTLDLNAVAAMKRMLTHLPVLVDPSHSTGMRELVPLASFAGVAAGADGLLIETHPDPRYAKCDGPQALLKEELHLTIQKCREIYALVRTSGFVSPALH